MEPSHSALLSLADYSTSDIEMLLSLAKTVKKQRRDRKLHQRLAGYSLAMLFEKLSTRTRSSFETAFGEEGGHTVFLSQKDIHLGSKESLADTARVFGRMYDAIAFRGFSQETARQLSHYSGIPVINALTDDFHPTQALADFLTIEEHFGKLRGLTVAYMGDGRNNVATSLLIAGAKLGVEVRIVAPAELAPSAEQLALTGDDDTSMVYTNPEKGLKGADVVYTDVWVSMGEEDKKRERETLLTPYQVNKKAMEATGKENSIFLHCLPAVKDQEVTEDIFESSASLVWEQAENRKHTIKAVLFYLLGISP